MNILEKLGRVGGSRRRRRQRERLLGACFSVLLMYGVQHLRRPVPHDAHKLRRRHLADESRYTGIRHFNLGFSFSDRGRA